MIFADVHSTVLVWHDQFKTSVLALAATFGLVAANTTPLTNDNTDIHTNVTNGKGSPAEQHISRVGRLNMVVILSYVISNLSLCIALMFIVSNLALSSCSMTRISRR